MWLGTNSLRCTRSIRSSVLTIQVMKSAKFEDYVLIFMMMMMVMAMMMMMMMMIMTMMVMMMTTRAMVPGHLVRLKNRARRDLLCRAHAASSGSARHLPGHPLPLQGRGQRGACEGMDPKPKLPRSTKPKTLNSKP